MVKLRQGPCRTRYRSQIAGICYLRREETNASILDLSKGGTPIKQIVRQTGHSRKLVRQVIRGESHDVFRTRQSSLDQHLPWLDDQWEAGSIGKILGGAVPAGWALGRTRIRCPQSDPERQSGEIVQNS